MISEMLGKTLTAVEQSEYEIIFTCDDGAKYRMYHSQDCCEYVYIESIDGELQDLVGSPVTMAEEVSSFDPPPFPGLYEPESYTWTFYKLATVNGYVTIRWFGSSNGYYGERADVELM